MSALRLPRAVSGALPQILTLVLVLGANWILFPGFFDVRMQDGRLFGVIIDVLVRGAPVAILAIGMTLVISTKGVDLSVGAVMAISGAVAATLATQGQPLPVILAAALGAGLLCGLWNGLLVAVLDIQPIIATLILMVTGRGIAQLITEGQIITFTHQGLIQVASSSAFGLPMPVVIAAVLGALAIAVVRLTALGLMVESIGVNRRASSFTGIDSRTVLIAAYAVSGLCAGVAGVIAAADIRGADANNAGLWLELDAILAVVIGGTSLFGGRFSILLSLVGALVIQAMNTGILLSGYPPELNLIVKATVIVLILLVQSPASRTFVEFLKRAGSRP